MCFHWSYAGGMGGKNQEPLNSSTYEIVFLYLAQVCLFMFIFCSSQSILLPKRVQSFKYLIENAYLVSKMENKIPRRQTWDTKKRAIITIQKLIEILIYFLSLFFSSIYPLQILCERVNLVISTAEFIHNSFIFFFQQEKN